MLSPARSFTVNAVNSASATAKAKKTSSVPLASSSMPSCCGTPATSTPPLAQLRRDGYPVEDADVERRSPLIHDHINLLGRYCFTNPDNLGGGQLRPLRDPRTAED